MVPSLSVHDLTRSYGCFKTDHFDKGPLFELVPHSGLGEQGHPVGSTVATTDPATIGTATKWAFALNGSSTDNPNEANTLFSTRSVGQ